MSALRLAPLTGLVVALVAAAPAGAGAATLSGEVTDPVDSAGSPAQDITRISSSYDADAGTWIETIRFHGPLTTDDKAKFYSTLVACGSGTPGSPAPPVLNPASMQTWTDPADGSIGAFANGIVGGVPTWGPASGPATKEVSVDGRTLTLTLTDPLLVGRDVCSVSFFRLSAFGTVYDRVGMIELKPPSDPAGGDGRPGAPGGPDGGPAPDFAAPTATISRSLVVPRRGRPRLTVARLSEPARGTVVVRRRGGGRVLASGRFRSSAAAGSEKVPLRLARGVRGAIGRRGRLLVTIRVTLSDAAGNTATSLRRGVLRPGR
jgi:hypothetical protein